MKEREKNKNLSTEQNFFVVFLLCCICVVTTASTSCDITNTLCVLQMLFREEQCLVHRQALTLLSLEYLHLPFISSHLLLLLPFLSFFFKSAVARRLKPLFDRVLVSKAIAETVSLLISLLIPFFGCWVLSSDAIHSCHAVLFPFLSFCDCHS